MKSFFQPLKKCLSHSRYLLVLLFLTGVFSGRAAVWTSTVNGSWTSATTWSLVSGTPAASYPTSNDFVTVSNYINVGVPAYCTQLTVNAGATINIAGGQALVVYGNFTNNGTVTTATSANLYFGSSAAIPSPTVTQTGTISGSMNIIFRPYGRTITISSTSTFSNVPQLSFEDVTTGGVVNNQGNITVTSLFSINNGVTFNNSTNGVLTTRVNISVSSGTFQATGNPNTVNFSGTTWNTVHPTTYHHLVLANAGVQIATKTLGGNIVCNGNFTISNTVQLNCANRDITVGGAWVDNNNASSITNTGGTFTFAGTNPTIRRWLTQEVLGNVVVACTGTFTPSNAGNPNYTGNFSCSNLVLQSGVLDLNATSNYTVTVRGNMSSTGGSLNGQNGYINFAGTTSQTILGNTMTFSNINVSNTAGVSTTTAHNLTGLLNVASGSFTSGVADFTLISNTTTGITARIAPLTTGSIAGSRWVVQRRVLTGAPSSSAPYWGDYSSPMTSANLSDWDDEMYLSGVGGADGTACCPTFYSVQQWNNGGGNYSNVTSLIPLVAGYGYSIWTASDLSSLSPFTFNTRGTPNSGTIVKSGLASDYYLLGNPYPSQILFSSIGRTNVGNYFWILDETLQDYAFWDGATSTGTGKLSGTGGVINSSQGFMVQSTGGGSVTFSETNKTATNVAFVREATPSNMVRFHFTHDDKQVGMQNVIHFAADGYNGKDENDIPYLPAPFLLKRTEVKMLTMNGEALCKNTLNLNDLKQDVPVVFKPAEAGNYVFSVEGLSGLSAYTCVMLEDISTGTFTDLSVKSTYAFNCSDNGERHFVLHLTRGKESISCTKKSEVFAEIAAGTSIASRVYATENAIAVTLSNAEVKSTSITVYNAVGQLVHSQEYLGGGEFTIERPGVMGIYFVILSREGKTETHKITIN